MPLSNRDPEEICNILTKYINKCSLIFDEKKRLVLSKIKPINKDIEIDINCLFNQAIKEAEDSDEFAIIVKLLKEHLLTSIAADCFFKNTGTYYSLWMDKEIDINLLMNILHESIQNKSYDIINILVFDGFYLYDNEKNKEELREIILPFGKMQIIHKNDIEKLFMIPQSEWHYRFSLKKITNLINYHVLKITGKEKYRKPKGIIAGNKFHSVSFYEWKKREDDINYIGPLFLCLGKDANLAEEIIIRTCIFDSQPISFLTRNDYMRPEPGEDSPNFVVKYIGKDGIMLAKICEIWSEVNQLHHEGYLRFSTEAYVRAIMNWHSRYDSLMETFVSFVTVIDSLLTRGELYGKTKKISSRGGAILSSNSEKIELLKQYLTRIYNIRSSIVHEGHTNGENLENILVVLPEITRQIFIKFLMLTYLIKNRLFGHGIMDNISNIEDTNKSITKILDLSITEPEIVKTIDRKLSEMSIELEELRKSFLSQSVVTVM